MSKLGALAGFAILGFSISSAQAHTNTVGFKITPSSATTCVGGAGSTCYDVEVFYGSWHTGQLPAEGQLALFYQQPGGGEVQVVGPSAAGGSATPFTMSHSLVTSIPNSTNSTTYNYAPGAPGNANLASVFTIGTDYFYTDSSYSLSATTSGSGFYSHQSAIGQALGPGTYRIAYDPAATPSSATWSPVSGVQNATFTVTGGGGVVVDTGGAPNVSLSASAPAANGSYTITATFSEAVTGVELSDFVTSGGAASNLVAVSASVYTVTLTPSSPGVSMTVDMPQDAASDVDSNGSNAAITLNLTAPAGTGLSAATLQNLQNTVLQEEAKTVRNQLAINRRMTRNARERFLAARRCRVQADEVRDEGLPSDESCDEEVTRNYVPFDISGAAEVSQDRALLFGSFYERIGSVGAGSKRRLIFGDFEVSHNSDSGTTVTLDARIAWEKDISDDAMAAYFLGMDLSHSNASGVFDGDRDRIGFSAGLYGVRHLQNEVAIDGYASLSIGHNVLELTDGATDIDARYNATAVLAGATLSGRRNYERFDLIPQASIDLAHADLGDVSFDAAALGLNQSGSISGGDLSMAILEVKPEFVFPLRGVDFGALSVAPSVICQHLDAVTSETDCGGAMEIGVKTPIEIGEDGDFEVRLRGERIGDATRTSVSFSVDMRF